MHISLPENLKWSFAKSVLAMDGLIKFPGAAARAGGAISCGLMSENQCYNANDTHVDVFKVCERIREPMVNDPGQGLHDRATRGQTLSADEQTQLDAWYAAQDRVESQLLSGVTAPPQLAALQSQVEAALQQLQTVTQRTHKLMGLNEAVRLLLVSLYTKDRPPFAAPSTE